MLLLFKWQSVFCTRCFIHWSGQWHFCFQLAGIKRFIVASSNVKTDEYAQNTQVFPTLEHLNLWLIPPPSIPCVNLRNWISQISLTFLSNVSLLFRIKSNSICIIKFCVKRSRVSEISCLFNYIHRPMATAYIYSHWSNHCHCTRARMHSAHIVRWIEY